MKKDKTCKLHNWNDAYSRCPTCATVHFIRDSVLVSNAGAVLTYRSGVVTYEDEDILFYDNIANTNDEEYNTRPFSIAHTDTLFGLPISKYVV